MGFILFRKLHTLSEGYTWRCQGTTGWSVVESQLEEDRLEYLRQGQKRGQTLVRVAIQSKSACNRKNKNTKILHKINDQRCTWEDKYIGLDVMAKKKIPIFSHKILIDNLNWFFSLLPKINLQMTKTLFKTSFNFILFNLSTPKPKNVSFGPYIDYKSIIKWHISMCFFQHTWHLTYLAITHRLQCEVK